MIRSLFTGISGIKSNQTALEVIGNNIANINTTAYKASRASFADALSLYLKTGTAPTSSNGGMNPLQIGNGSTIGSIDSFFTQGSIEATGNPTDLAIAGDGFFILSNGKQQYYTRDGSFGIDPAGNLIDPATGLIVQGKMADSSGQIPMSAIVGNITVDPNTLALAKATSSISLAGNLDATAKVADTGGDGIDDPDNGYQMSVIAYDSLGNTHNILITFGLTDTPNQWTWEATLSPEDGNVLSSPSPASGTLHFKSDGSIDPTVATELSVKLVISGAAGAGNPLNNGAAEQAISLNFGDLIQFSEAFSPAAHERDGYGVGTLENVKFDESGALIGTFSNGATQKLAQLVLADFTNPEGLTKVGSNLYDISANSGVPRMGYAGQEIGAAIIPDALESSNVDLASEFVRMMIAQRGFEANSRVIATSDNLLGELVNLKR